MLGRNGKMQPRFVDVSNFAQGFGIANREAISEAREVLENQPGEISPAHNTGVA